MGSEFLGNPIAAIIIAVVAGPVFYFIMGLSMILITLFIIFLFYEDPEPVEDSIVKEEGSSSFCDVLIATLSLLISKRMLTLMPMLLFTGVSLSVWSSMLVPIV